MSDVDEARTRLLAAYDEAVRKDARLARLRTRAEEGKATYADADQFAAITGRLIGILLVAELLLLAPEGPVPEEAAAELIPPGLIRNYKAVTSLTDTVQKGLNAKVGLGLKPVTPKLDQSRVNNLVKYVAKQEDFREQREVLPQLTENLSQSQVDDAARANAEFQYGAGRRAKVVRSGGGHCCEWCMGLVGTYEYPDVPKEVWQRHANCSCVVEYFPGDGRKQNVHTKQWAQEGQNPMQEMQLNRSPEEEQEVIEQRKAVGQEQRRGKDVTAEYFGTAQPGKGGYFIEEGVDEKDSKNEIEMARWLHGTFGGDITVLKAVNQNRVKTPDFRWRGKLWDLKTTHTDKAARSATQGGLKQIKPDPGGLLIEIKGLDRDIDKTIANIEDRIRQGSITDLDVMLVRNSKVVTILRYHK